MAEPEEESEDSVDKTRKGISLDNSDLGEEKQVVGRKIWRIFPYVVRYWKLALGGLIANAGARASDLLPFLTIGWAADFYANGTFNPPWLENYIGDSPYLGFGIIIFMCFALLAVFQGTSNFLWQATSYNSQHDSRMDAARSLINMEASYFEDRQTGNLMSVLSADISLLEDVISDSSTSIVRIAITFAMAAIILSFMSIKLTLMLFSPLVLIIPMVIWFATRVQRRYRKQRESTGSIVSILENVLGGITVMQAYNAQDFEKLRVNSESGRYRDQAISASFIRNRFIPGIYLVAGIAFGLIVTAGGWVLESGEITIGEYVTFLLISTRMTFPLFILGALLNQIQRGEAAARRVFAIVDLEPSIVDRPDAIPLEDPIKSVIFDDVTFEYPSSDTHVLNGISFEAKPGDFIGIMGHTGAGKSTILKLIERFYEPQSGKILVNGVDINNLKIDSIRARIGFVSQDPFLFFGTIRDNIAYAREASEEEIEEALHAAGAKEFVMNLPRGIDTEVGDRGVKLSGGQKARISLARALLTKPDLLILDEASAALDAETEQRIQNSLFSSNDADRMTIAVAHRLATIRNADEILAMVDGVIVERGLHETLVEADNVYASQWRIQTGELDSEVS
ncbi:MAG TPA: ABC transporter ATP-binding protein [Candidatus Thalassarchaeaceae archaeon]|nr:MAG TPA: ABC transporter ATP-binding protein [Candidatus Poseidoniales archaeon]HII89482.1 ABC transporter ATP-binding protein [Candidatus Thalassarchaeaceae archaeon]